MGLESVPTLPGLPKARSKEGDPKGGRAATLEPQPCCPSWSCVSAGESLPESEPGMLTECHPWGRYNEINAISTACSNGLPKCEELAKNLYNRWMMDPQNNP